MITVEGGGIDTSSDVCGWFFPCRRNNVVFTEALLRRTTLPCRVGGPGAPRHPAGTAGHAEPPSAQSMLEKSKETIGAYAPIVSYLHWSNC
jgi:hypothetical protein